MKLEMKDKGRYMDGNTPRNVMFSVYPSGSEWKVSGFGMVREPGLVSWKYFTYPLSAFRGIKTQRNHAIWLCLDFLAEERTETVCLPGLSNVSEVERTLREYLADRDKPVREPLAVKETPAAEGEPAPAQSPSSEAVPQKTQKDSDPTRTPSYFVTEAVKEAIGLYRYPAYALYRDDESAAALYQDSGGSLCFLGADGSYKKEDRRVIERRHIHYYGPAGQVDGSKEAAARIPVDLSWIPHPEAYFLYWGEMGRRAASGEKLRGILLHYFDPKESVCGDLLLPEGVLGFLREHFPEKDYERQQAAKRLEDVGEATAMPSGDTAAKDGDGPDQQDGSGKEAAKTAVSEGVRAVADKTGAGQESRTVPTAGQSAALTDGVPGRGATPETEAMKPFGSASGRTAAPVYDRPSYAKASEAFSNQGTDSHRVEAAASRQEGSFTPAGAASGPSEGKSVSGTKLEQRDTSSNGNSSGAEQPSVAVEATAGSEEACPLAHGLHDPNPGGKLTVSQYWDLAKKLKKLWDDGLIDEPEYRRIKRGLLDRT